MWIKCVFLDVWDDWPTPLRPGERDTKPRELMCHLETAVTLTWTSNYTQSYTHTGHPSSIDEAFGHCWKHEGTHRHVVSLHGHLADWTQHTHIQSFLCTHVIMFIIIITLPLARQSWQQLQSISTSPLASVCVCHWRKFFWGLRQSYW